MHFSRKDWAGLIIVAALMGFAVFACVAPAYPDALPAQPPSAAIVAPAPTNSPQAGTVVAEAVPAPASECLNCAAPSAEAELGVVSTYTDGAWEVGPRLYVYGEAGPSLGTHTPVRVFAEASLGLRSGDSPGAEDVGATDISTVTAVRGSVGVSRVIGARDYQADTDASDQRVRRVLTSVYARAGGEFAIDREANLEPRVAKVAEAGIRVQTFRASQETADVWVGVGYDQSAVPAEPIVLDDGSISRSIQVIVSGKLPIVRRGALSGALVGRIVTNMIRSDDDGRHDRVELGLVASWD